MLGRKIILTEILAALRKLMALEVGEDILELEEEAFARLVIIWIHVEGSGELRVER